VAGGQGKQALSAAAARIALDTDVQAYAEGVNGAERQAAANRIPHDLARDDISSRRRRWRSCSPC
jgi:hypothetical protein